MTYDDLEKLGFHTLNWWDHNRGSLYWDDYAVDPKRLKAGVEGVKRALVLIEAEYGPDHDSGCIKNLKTFLGTNHE